MKVKISGFFVVLLVAAVFLGCGSKNSKAQPQEAVSDNPVTLEIVYQKDGEGSIHYILRDNETGYEYIVVERHYASRGGSVSITPRLGINGHNKVSHPKN